MHGTTIQDVQRNLTRVKAASYALQALEEDQIIVILNDFAARLRTRAADILAANQKDLARMDQDSPLYDRLLLTPQRLDAIADDIGKVGLLDSPVGAVLEHRTLPNGLDLSRVRVPLGVVGIIYESRPNVTADVFSLCFRTRNACVLRGGSDAHDTNLALVALIHEVLTLHGVDPFSVYLLPPERALADAMMQAHGFVDMIIPRGSQALINHVRETATVPVIETGAGVVHVYFDKDGDVAKGAAIIDNAKTRRPSVCNSLDTLLIHKDRCKDLPALLAPLQTKSVRVHVDPACRAVLAGHYPDDLLVALTPEVLGIEYMALSLNIVAVASVEEALAHVRQYSSGHTEAIVTENTDTAERYLAAVDAAVVMVNASTGFSDGGQFGLGAEIGISTQKLHARGPMGLEPLTSYKWLVRGAGQVRAG